MVTQLKNVDLSSNVWMLKCVRGALHKYPIRSSIRAVTLLIADYGPIKTPPDISTFQVFYSVERQYRVLAKNVNVHSNVSQRPIDSPPGSRVNHLEVIAPFKLFRDGNKRRELESAVSRGSVTDN